MKHPATETSDDALVAALSEEARRLAAAGASEPSPGAWHRLEARRQTQSNRWRGRSWLGVVAGVAVGAVVAFGARTLRSGRPLTYEVAGGTVDEVGYVRAEAGAGAQLRFSDGTRVQLSPGAKLSVGVPGPRGARLRVQDGEAHFQVMHLPRAAWSVEAGPYLVEVTGTTFDVRWSGAEEIAEVRLRAGSVRVSGPLLGEHATLRPGQTLIAHLAAHELRIEDENARPSTPPPTHAARVPVAPAPEAAPAVAEAPVAAALPVPAAPERRKRPHARLAVRQPQAATTQSAPDDSPRASWPPRDWTTRVAAGDAKGILADAEAHGLDAVLAEADAPALVALADAARYGGRRDLAARVLLAERHRFPGTPTAANAAFFLGRLADDSGRPSDAMDWYRRYLAEQSRGAYASEALGRTMLGVARLSGRAAARQMAEDYLSRFPNGTYLLHAHQILSGQ